MSCILSRFYNQGRLRQLQDENNITSVENSNGQTIVDPLGINETFKSFSEKWYSSDIIHMGHEQNSFPDALQIPNISEWISTDLGAVIITDEISIATDNMKLDKNPGTGGQPMEIYEKFKAKLLLPILDMFRFIWKGNPTCFIKRDSNYIAAQTWKTLLQIWKRKTNKSPKCGFKDTL